MNKKKRKKRKRKAILLLAYIADVSCLTNRSFYMRTLSLRKTYKRMKLENTRASMVWTRFPQHSTHKKSSL